MNHIKDCLKKEQPHFCASQHCWLPVKTISDGVFDLQDPAENGHDEVTDGRKAEDDEVKEDEDEQMKDDKDEEVKEEKPEQVERKEETIKEDKTDEQIGQKLQSETQKDDIELVKSESKPTSSSPPTSSNKPSSSVKRPRGEISTFNSLFLNQKGISI